MSEQQSAGAPRVLRVTALVAVCAGVAALAAAAFIFSYAGIHSVALQAGVNVRLARGYPLILDVLLVVVLAAVLALRGAGWPSKLLAWISLIALLAAAAGADALHAAHDKLPARTAEITVAVVPWALVLIAFVLLLAMLRQARLRRSQTGPRVSRPKWQPQEPPPLSTQPLVPGFAPPAAPVTPDRGPADTLKLVVPRQPAPEIAADRIHAVTAPMVAIAPMATPAPGGLAREDVDITDDITPGPDHASALSASRGPATEPNPTTEFSPAKPDLALEPATLDAEPATLEVEHAPDVTPALDAESGPDAEPSLDAELTPDDPSSDEAGLDPAAGAVPYPSERREDSSVGPGGLSPAPVAAGGQEASDDEDAADTDMPVFHRMWSSPVPPGPDS
jgi:Protein of unknown function (DUF2637)